MKATRVPLTGFTIGRVILAILSVWLALVVISNFIDALSVLGVLPKNTPFASGNYDMIATQLAGLALPAWIDGVLFACAIVLEAAAATILARSAFQRSARSEDIAFAILIVLFGGFVLFDELSRAFSTEAIHRNLVVFVGVLYLVVRTDRQPASGA